MTSLDAEYLFTNIPLEKTVKICCDSLYKNQELLSNINKNQFEKLHFAATIFFFFFLIVSFMNKLMKKYGSIIVSMSLILCIIKNMLTIHLFYFDLLTTVTNLMNI